MCPIGKKTFNNCKSELEKLRNELRKTWQKIRSNRKKLINGQDTKKNRK